MMMLDIAMDLDTGFLELTLDGDIHDVDYQRAVDAVNLLLTRHKKIDVVETVKGFGWVDPGVWFKDLAFHLTHHNFMRHVAIVSDKGWVGPLANLVAPLYPATLRTFRLAEIETARRWAKAHDPAAEMDETPLDFA
jgi:hypothetical protein